MKKTHLYSLKGIITIRGVPKTFEQFKKELASKHPDIVSCLLNLTSVYKMFDKKDFLINYLSQINVEFSSEIKKTIHSKRISVEEINAEINTMLESNELDNRTKDILENIKYGLDKNYHFDDLNGMLDGCNFPDHNDISPIQKKCRDLINKIKVFCSIVLGEYCDKTKTVTIYLDAIKHCGLHDPQCILQVYAHEMFHALHFCLIKQNQPNFTSKPQFENVIEGLASYYEYSFIDTPHYKAVLEKSWNYDAKLWPYSYAKIFLPTHNKLFSIIFVTSLENIKLASQMLEHIYQLDKKYA